MVKSRTCEEEVNIPGKEAVMDSEEGTTKNTARQAATKWNIADRAE